MDGRTWRSRCRALGTSGLALLLLTAPVGSAARPVAAAGTPPDRLPACAGTPGAGGQGARWQAVLDEDGVLTGHELWLPGDGRGLDVAFGPRAFSVLLPDGRVLTGERSESQTRLRMLDGQRGCSLWQRTLDRLVYGAEAESPGGTLRLTAIESSGRHRSATLVLSAETGATTAMIDGQCLTECEPNDGTVDPAVLAAVSDPRPVPTFPAGGWPQDASLPFRWHASAEPPDWVKTPVVEAARDAAETSVARSPVVKVGQDTDASVRYTSAFPTFCRYGIACAWRDMPSWWTVFIRPHGTDFSWGRLRWCQKSDADGCFDLRRVMIHELGHIFGLDHPENAGFRLGTWDTVMQPITPARPQASWARHAYGPCDVASLQELYDVPSHASPISRCQDLETRLTWRPASAASVPANGSASWRTCASPTATATAGWVGTSSTDARSSSSTARWAATASGSPSGWSRSPGAAPTSW